MVTRRSIRTRLAALLAVGTVSALTATATAAVPSREGSADPAQQLVAEAQAARSHCVTVVRDGRTVLDRDLDPAVATSPGWSVTKSVASLLVGIAEDRRLLDLDDRVAEHVPAWRRTPSRKVTVRHLLANTSGRQWSYATDYERMAGRARDKTRFAVRLRQEARPGTVWRYNNAAIQVLEQVLEEATGTSVPRFARKHLFRPLGMRSTSFQLDGAGNAMVFAGLLTTCGDLARLGVMLADGGRADGRRIVSPGYLAEATQRPSSTLNAAYGYLFWINEPGPALGAIPPPAGTPPEQGPLVPSAPADTYWAIGLFQQLLLVSPSTGVVAVRMGEAPPPDAPLTLPRFTELALAVGQG